MKTTFKVEDSEFTQVSINIKLDSVEEVNRMLLLIQALSNSNIVSVICDETAVGADGTSFDEMVSFCDQVFPVSVYTKLEEAIGGQILSSF